MTNAHQCTKGSTLCFLALELSIHYEVKIWGRFQIFSVYVLPGSEFIEEWIFHDKLECRDWHLCEKWMSQSYIVECELSLDLSLIWPYFELCDETLHTLICVIDIVFLFLWNELSYWLIILFFRNISLLHSLSWKCCLIRGIMIIRHWLFFSMKPRRTQLSLAFLLLFLLLLLFYVCINFMSLFKSWWVFFLCGKHFQGVHSFSGSKSFNLNRWIRISDINFYRGIQVAFEVCWLNAILLFISFRDRLLRGSLGGNIVSLW